MSAFDPSKGGGMGDGPDMDDIFAQMFGGMGGMGGMGGFPGGMPGMGGMPGGRGVPRKGRSVEQEYEITLEELYKGKTTKFSNTKNTVCQTCKGSGGKPGSKSHACSQCHGQGEHAHIGASPPDTHLTYCRSKGPPSTGRPRPCNARNSTLRQLRRLWANYPREATLQEVQREESRRV
jgi:DnaJ-class molecular chaperone